jgi:hypothetical protein
MEYLLRNEAIPQEDRDLVEGLLRHSVDGKKKKFSITLKPFGQKKMGSNVQLLVFLN